MVSNSYPEETQLNYRFTGLQWVNIFIHCIHFVSDKFAGYLDMGK